MVLLQAKLRVGSVGTVGTADLLANAAQSLLVLAIGDAGYSTGEKKIKINFSRML